MNNNLKLRKAIIVAIALVGTGYSLHSKALGLGDIEVKSYLGQPLLANIKVHGLDKKTNESCFSVASDDTSAIREVKFQLKHLANEQGLLTVTSNHAVLEPIAQLTVVSQCESTFTRQYSLLIDPSNSQPEAISRPVIDSSVSSDASLPSAVNDMSEANPVQNVAPRKKVAKRTSKRSKAKVASNANTSAWNPKTGDFAPTVGKSTTPADAPKANPKLTISGGDISATSLNAYSMRLNFDKKINTNRELNPLAHAEEAEFADEVTVMHNRLAHLEKQLTGLYSKNVRLETENKENATALSEIKHQNDLLRTLSFCLGGGLLGSGYFFVDWLRRKKAEKDASKTLAIWDDLEQTPEQDEPPQAFKIDENYIPAATTDGFEVKTQDDLTEFEQTHIFNAPFLVSDTPIATESSHDVIEDADVFISHGRTSLAVQLLQHHLMAAPKKSASTWLFLLDLLAKEGLQKEFDIAAQECKKHFNVQLADFSAPMNDSNTLESFEYISTELQKIWGTPQALAFLDELIYNTRMEPRMGFDKAVFEELVLLREIAQEELATPVSQEEIILTSKETDSTIKPRENIVKLNLPEIEVSDDFKNLSEELTLVAEQQRQADEAENEHFEFELLDIANR